MPITIFIDSTPDIDRLWRKVHGAGDPPITVNQAPVAEADLPKAIARFDTVINDATYFDGRRCRAARTSSISVCRTGAASFVDLAAAASLGIKVSTIKGYGDATVAEHAMGLVFASARHIATMHTIVRANVWRPMQGLELRGKTLGVVGLGGIGRELARIAKGVGLNVIAYNRSPVSDPPATMLSIEEVLARSDIVSLRLPLKNATRPFSTGTSWPRPSRASSSSTPRARLLSTRRLDRAAAGG